MTIAVNNLTTNKVNQQFVKQVISNVLKQEGVSEAQRLSLAFIGPGRMKKLNKKYRKVNRVTDVLAFPEKEVPFEKFSISSLKQTQNIGEIVVCLREVKKAVKRFNVSFEQELARVLIHGTLHLLGYDHEKSASEANQMQEKEEEYLKNAKIN